MSHWHPLRFRYNRVLRTSLISTLRGRPPRGFCLAGGIMGLTMAHCSSVRSEGYFFLQRPTWSIFTHSSTEGICANYLIKLYFCQSIFPDSLSEERLASGDWRNCTHREENVDRRALEWRRTSVTATTMGAFASERSLCLTRGQACLQSALLRLVCAP